MSSFVKSTMEVFNDRQLQPDNPDLDTGQCFLCLQTASCNNKTDNPWIQHIFNYWGVSRKSLIKTEPEEFLEDGQGTSEHNFETARNENFVKLCIPCNDMIAKLSSLIREHEVTQMWIDYQIQQVNKVLQVSENPCLDITSLNLDFYQLRENFKSKCRNITSISFCWFTRY